MQTIRTWLSHGSAPLWRRGTWLFAVLALVMAGCIEDPVSPVPTDQANSVAPVSSTASITGPTASISGTTGESVDSDASLGQFCLRYTGDPPPAGVSHACQWGVPYLLSANPENGPVVFEGTIDVSGQEVGNTALIGLIDYTDLAGGDSPNGWLDGAYIYVFRRSSTVWKIGPSDGNGSGSQTGELIQEFIEFTDTDVPDGVLTVVFTIDGTQDPATCGGTTSDVGCLTLELAGGSVDVTITDSYGALLGPGSATPKFSNGGIPGWDDALGTPSNVAYDLTVGPMVVSGDDEAPVVTNVEATPNPASVSEDFDLNANVDDTGLGDSNIASAEYSLDGGAWTAMDAADGAFDEVSEDVEAIGVMHGMEPGLYPVCVRGTDAAGNTSTEECTTLVVYDPSGGFVTGGGWIDGSLTSTSFGTIWMQSFESDTDGWSDFGSGTVHRVASGYANSGGFADGVASAAGAYHARLRTTQSGDCAPPFSQSTSCVGPFTGFGGPYTGSSAADGWTTSTDVYLDVAWAQSHSDWRFDYSVALNKPDDSFLRDFVFNVGTSPSGAAEFVISAGNNAFRNNSFPSNPDHDPQTISQSGWYTFRHSFSESGGSLVAELEILDSGGATVASWTLGGDPVSDVGRVRYGWFANQEIHDLAIDDVEIAGPSSSTVTGKATFGFVSKYKKGADRPDGNTEFQFKAADLNFHSTSYDWLVVTGSDYARFKGEGTINGTGSYKFMLWAGDHDAGDTFRIKIWEEVGGVEEVVYDNGMDQVIGGGSIIVHDGKGKNK